MGELPRVWYQNFEFRKELSKKETALARLFPHQIIPQAPITPTLHPLRLRMAGLRFWVLIHCDLNLRSLKVSFWFRDGTSWLFRPYVEQAMDF